MKNGSTVPRTLEARLESRALKSRLRITGRVFDKLQFLVVKVREGEHVGHGEAAGVYYRNDVPASMLEQIKAVRPAIEDGAGRSALQKLLPPCGARNALDCALWELDAKLQSMPVWSLAEIPRPRPLTCTYTLGAGSPDEAAAGARAFSDARAIKLKLDGEDLDADRVRAVREARPDVWLGIDANQGFTLAKLDRLMPVFADCRVSLIEQPLPVGRGDDLLGFESPIPLAADETAQCAADLPGLVGRFDVVNIKLDKAGGLTEGLKVAAAARRLGLGVMVGNMFGTSRAIAPAFVLGQLCDIVDLDGPLLLSDDITPGAVYESGRIWCDEDVWGSPSAGTQS